METTKDIICKNCGAMVRGDVTYCPHCGELLSEEADDNVIAKSEYDKIKADNNSLRGKCDTLTTEKRKTEDQLSLLKRQGYAPDGSCIIKKEEYKTTEELKNIIEKNAYDLQKERERTRNAEEEKEKALRERKGALDNLQDVQFQNTIIREENKRKNQRYKIIICASLAIILLLGGVYAYQYINVDDSEIKTFSAPNEVLNKLPGNYTLREYRNGEIVGISKTAVLRKDNSYYTFTIVTDYGPENHSFTNISNNLLHSETLGEGEVTYKEVINKITITFKKDNYSWEFIK